MALTEKKCFTCLQVLPINCFYSNKAKSTGVYGSCIPCVKSKMKYPKSNDYKIVYDENNSHLEYRKFIYIDGIRTDYIITNFGRVLLPNGNFGKPSFDQRGYPQIILTVNKKRYGRRLHILVARAFLINEQNLREVNHKDGNKLNPNVNNLEYVSSKENINHAIKNKLRLHFSPHSK